MARYGREFRGSPAERGYGWDYGGGRRRWPERPLRYPLRHEYPYEYGGRGPRRYEWTLPPELAGGYGAEYPVGPRRSRRPVRGREGYGRRARGWRGRRGYVAEYRPMDRYERGGRRYAEEYARAERRYGREYDRGRRYAEEYRRGGDRYGGRAYARTHPRYGFTPSSRWPEDGHDLDRIPAHERYMTDQQIEDAVRENLFQDSWVDPRRIDVEVDRGVATLKGDVDDYMEARYAWDDAWETAGVRGVINNLTVRTDRPADEMGLPQTSGRRPQPQRGRQP